MPPNPPSTPPQTLSLLEVVVSEAQHPLSHIQTHKQVTQQRNHIAHVAEPGVGVWVGAVCKRGRCEGQYNGWR